MIGRLEATVHAGIAEVAFLFGRSHWGRGLALEALSWLHAEIERHFAITGFWATTLPANTRCQSLLQRGGYRIVQGRAPVLYSFDAGDLVFHRGASPAAAAGRSSGTR